MVREVLLWVGLVAAMAASAGNAEDAAFETKPGEVWRLDWSWRWVDVPNTSYVRPVIMAWNAKGAMVYSNAVVNIYKRVFDPKDPAVQKRRQYVRIAGGKDDGPLYCSDSPVSRLPASAHRIGMSVESCGDAAVISDLTTSWTKLEQKDLKTLQRSKSFPVIEEKPADVLDDAALDAVLARREKCVPTLVSDGDRTDLRINGRTVVPKFYKTSASPSPNRYPSVGDAARMGFNVITVNVPLTPFEGYDGVWRPDGSCDVEWVRRELREHLKRFPEGMFMFVITMKPHVGWAEQNPGEILADEKGWFGIYSGCRLKAYREKLAYNPKWEFPMFSLASEKYAVDASKMLETLFSAVETWPEGKAVIGAYVVGGADTQWHDSYDMGGYDENVKYTPLADLSPVMRRRFAAFRRARYGRDDVDVHVPTKEELVAKDRIFYAVHAATLCSDYREFEGRTANELRLALARAIKRASHSRMLVGSYLPNGGTIGYTTVANSFVQELLESPDYDFVAVVPRYLREYVDPIHFPSFYGSAVRRGKLVIGEMDIRSADVGNWGFWAGDFWRGNHDERTFRRKALQVAAAALVQGGGYHAYDMDGGWFATDAAKATWKVVNEMSEHVHGMPQAPETIALVGSERYFDHKAFNGKCLGAVSILRVLPRMALGRIGAPNTHVLVEELLHAEKDNDLPKVVIFNDLSAVTFAQYQELRRRYASDGRVILWGWHPGIFAADGAKIEQDLGLLPDDKIPTWPAFADGKCADPLMKGVRGTVIAAYPSFGYVHLPPVCRIDPGKGWKTLACLKGTDQPALVVRRGADCTEVLSTVPAGFTPQLCRNLLREAGLRPLLETNDLSGYGSGIFYILAQFDGTRRFRLPKGVVPDKVLAGPPFRTDGEGYVVELKRAEMFVLAVRNE